MHKPPNSIKNLFICCGVALFMLSFLLLLLQPIKRVDLPFMSWPDNTLFSVDNCLWVFLFTGFIYFFLKKDPVFTFAFSFLATLCRYETIPCVFAFSALYYFIFKEERLFLKKFLRSYGFFLMLFGCYTLILCLIREGGIRYLSELLYDKIFIRFDFTRNFIRKNFNFITTEDKIWGFLNWPNTRLFIKTSLLSTYFFIILFLIPSRDKITNLVSAFGIIFFVSVALQSFKLTTYSFLLIPLAAISMRRFVYPAVNVRLFNVISYMIIWFLCRALV